jgi:hypothetical protein
MEATVRAKFEMPGVQVALAALRMLPPRARIRAAKILARMAPRFGKQGGYVEVNGVRIEMTQRRAILPVVYAMRQLDRMWGCFGPTSFDHEELLAFVQQ